jgi:cytochrome b561
MILSTHISFNWQVKKNRRISGIILTIILFSLIISGYFLYYLGGEISREFTSYFHWIMGLMGGGFFIFHLMTKSVSGSVNRAKKGSMKLNR